MKEQTKLINIRVTEKEKILENMVNAKILLEQAKENENKERELVHDWIDDSVQYQIKKD